MKTPTVTNRKIPTARRGGNRTVAALIWCCLLLLWPLPAPAATSTTKLSVDIRGISGELKTNVAAFLQLAQLAKSGKPLPDETRLRFLYQQGPAEIRQALQPFGYFKPRIDSSLKRTASGWQAVYTIQPGPALPIGKTGIELLGPGKNDPVLQKIIAGAGLTPGKTLDQRHYEKLKSDLQAAATERGYFDAHLAVSRIIVDLQDYRATVILHFATGERYRLGEVSFSKSPLWPRLLQRYVQFHPGTPYRAQDLLQLQSDLLASGYFDQVIINAPPNKAVNHVIPVTVELTMRKRSKYTFGIGYATDTGARGRADFQRRWINRRGHSLEAQLAASQIKGSLGLAYNIPGKDPRTDAYKIRFTVEREKSDNRDYANADLGFTKQYFSHGWTKLYNLDYLGERFYIGSQQHTAKLLMAGLSWSRIDAKNRLNVTNGSSLTLEARTAVKPLLSTLSFAQADARFKWIRSLTPKNRLILRTEAGTTLISNTDFPNFPSSLRYYAGGDNSVRGYALDSIGPRDDQGNVIGGKYLLVGSIEYDYRLFDRWSIAAFVDTGDAFNSSPSFKTGAGLGLRWRSPVGPIRIDLAHGFEKPGDTIRLHFSIGPEL